jgi:hypothetical protein
MPGYRVEALPESIAAKARATGRSPQYGHPAHAEVARGTGPCRSCLKQFRVGEERRMLFTYNPFEGLANYPAPGPIFIHEAGCERYDEDGFPPEIRTLPMILEAYGDDRRLLAMEPCGAKEVDELLGKLLGFPDVRYVHVRNAEAGCFMANVVRA